MNFQSDSFENMEFQIKEEPLSDYCEMLSPLPARRKSRNTVKDKRGHCGKKIIEPKYSTSEASSSYSQTQGVGRGSHKVMAATTLGAVVTQPASPPPATITVVSTNPPQLIVQQSVSKSPSPETGITISAVTTHQNALQPNGQGENILGSPADESGDSAGADGGGDQTSGQDEGTTIVDSTHFITVSASEGQSVEADSVQHPTYIQYVEGTPDQTIYTTTNGQMAYPVYTVGEGGTAMFTPASGQYYTAGNSTPVTYTQVPTNITQNAGQTQILTNGGTYLIQQSVDNEHTIVTRQSPQTVAADVTYLVNSSSASGSASNTNDASNNGSNGSASAQMNIVDVDTQSNLVHATRVSPATVQWLLENYETAEGVSLPRSTLYYHYLRHCNEHKLDPVNAASFGKLIRSVFLGLRTRRLGTRGNSKYHYYGIRIKPSSPLNSILVPLEEGSSPVSRSGASKRYKFMKNDGNAGSGGVNGGGAGGGGGGGGAGANESFSSDQNNSSNHAFTPQSQNHQYLGDGSSAVPDFPEIELSPGVELPEDCTLEDVDTLRSIYREHCEAFLDAVVNLEFVTVESVWREFWRSQDNNNGDECEEEKYLPKTKLYLLCKYPPVQEFVRRVDYLFYQNLVQVLIPDVLRPIPSSLTQSIRNFAKGLESWLTCAMQGCPPEIVELKVAAVSAFAQTLRRYTSLNHLAQAARAVLQNSTQINQMLTDLNRVDFHNVQEQASWVCQCDNSLVQRLEADFKLTLQQQNSLEEWASWLNRVVTTVLKPFEGKPNFSKAARQFLLKWSFYSSMVIRDLTLRSAASFGSFHLIRLLYDEYMFYLIEHRVAVATGQTPIAVMGEKCTEVDFAVNSFPCNGNVSLPEETTTILVTGNEIHIPGNPPKRLKIS
ncbi:DNA-binding protein RFX2 isoform X2 [Bemisia tabaci]|uniref:DNA-binding protein RFX2 isoform X2 n=1 Tax=Bemisia tabaci TaxID=7038 RepID=UPI003B27D358